MGRNDVRQRGSLSASPFFKKNQIFLKKPLTFSPNRCILILFQGNDIQEGVKKMYTDIYEDAVAIATDMYLNGEILYDEIEAVATCYYDELVKLA